MSALETSARRGTRRLVNLVTRYRYALYIIAGSYIVFLCVLAAVYRLALILNRPTPEKHRVQNAASRERRKGHLLVVLGSGGHTSEMLSILQNLGAEYLNTRFNRRTWVVSEGDAFSAERAQRFEDWAQRETSLRVRWDVVTVDRARKIHQPLYTAPVSCLWCLWGCVQVLRGTHRDLKSTISEPRRKAGEITTTPYPDLILTNGPATAVVLVLASVLLMFFGLAPIESGADQGGSMRSIYIESWARVKTLSLSGRILRFFVGRFLVQWRGLEDVDLTGGAGQGTGDQQTPKAVQSINSDKMMSMWSKRVEYVGTVVT